MDKIHFKKILNKYLQEEVSDEEYRFLLSYYNLFDAKNDCLVMYSDAKKLELKNEIKKKIENVFAVDLKEGMESKRSIQFWISRIAVAAVILVVLSTGLYFFNRFPESEASVISQSKVIKENRLIRLPDGSTVIVSAGSKLNYPSSFDGVNRREVYLEGQAYFDVKHNPAKPFIIHTWKFKTTVLGTAFNIKAWSDDGKITVTVSRGKVKVGDHNNNVLGIITPNQQLTYDKKSRNIIQKTVFVPGYLDWKEEDLLLDDVTVAEAAELLEDRFKVKILITNEQVKSKRFTTIVVRGEGIEQILNSISEFNGAVYKYDPEKGEIVINSK